MNIITIEIFPNLTTILKIYMTIPTMNCETERNSSKLSNYQQQQRIFINHAKRKTEFSLHFLYRKWHYKIVVTLRGDQRVWCQTCRQKSII